MTPVTPAELETDRYDELEEKAVAAGTRAYRAREEEFTPAVLRDLERHLYLYTLDEHWRDHLYEVDHLKGGIGLRAFGQRDPLLEYKKEAFTLFESLMGEVNEDFVQRLFKVQLVEEQMASMQTRPRPRAMVERHESMGAFAGAPAAPDNGGGDVSAPPPVTAAARAPVRTVPRVGRNDPCPCGSGKKYKKCHMPIDEGVGAS